MLACGEKEIKLETGTWGLKMSKMDDQGRVPPTEEITALSVWFLTTCHLFALCLHLSFTFAPRILYSIQHVFFECRDC